MSCEERFSDEAIESYVRGKLDDRQSRALEEHFFECPACLERVEVLQAIAGVLSPAAARRANVLPWRSWQPAAVLASLAAAVVLLVVLRPELPLPTAPRPRATEAPPGPTTPPQPDHVATAPDYRDLAAISPPRYQPSSLRGRGASPELEAAMNRYASGDYAGAAAALDAVLRREPTHLQALFYGGVSALLAGRHEDGVARLQKVIAAGDTPYLEEARFYLAKAYLQRGDVEAAERELERVIALRGDLEVTARELLDRVRERRTAAAAASARPTTHP